MDFYEKTVHALVGEAKHKGLKTIEQVSQFVTHAISFKYGENEKINVSQIVAMVYQHLHMGTSDLPDELPDELKPLDLNSPEINNKITEVSTSLAKQYKADGIQPKIAQIHTDAKVALGLTDDSGMPLKLGDDVSNTQLAKITTITGAVLDPNQTVTFDDVKDGLKPIYEAVNSKINPE